MSTYYVTRIEEPDFGCEGRPEGQEIKDLRRGNGVQNRCVDPFDIDGIQRRIVRQLPAHQRQEAKEHPQIQMIFLDGTSGLALD